jgi:hypothetical protein
MYFVTEECRGNFRKESMRYFEKFEDAVNYIKSKVETPVEYTKIYKMYSDRAPKLVYATGGKK